MIGGIPAAKEIQNKCGIANYTPPPGAIIVKCDSCGCDVWIGVRQQGALKMFPSILTICPLCIVILAPDALRNVQSLGGQSGKFHLTDGTSL